MNSIVVIGVPETVARFARANLVAQEAETVMQGALAEDVATDAQAMVPIDTGRLRDSITAEADRVTTDVEYASYVEYGTSDTPAQPYMRPAADTVDDTRALTLGAAVMRTA